MKKFIKGIVTGALITIFVFSGFVTFGASITKKIDVILNNANVSINGRLLSGGNITYNNIVYVPITKVAESFGKTITYDKKSNTLNVSDKVAKNSYNINNPAPLNITQTILVQNYTDHYTAEIAVKEVVRGSEALRMLKEANSMNDDATEGFEYILAKVDFKLLDNIEGKSLSVSGYDFESFSGMNKKYDTASVVIPDPELRTELYKGASATGWVAFKVRQDDPNPKMVYGKSYDGTGGVWFSLK